MAKVKAAIPMEEWHRRKEILRQITEDRKSKDGSTYDCVVAVSGKDSYFQVHVIKEEFD